jgi:hypothetical protein
VPVSDDVDEELPVDDELGVPVSDDVDEELPVDDELGVPVSDDVDEELPVADELGVPDRLAEPVALLVSDAELDVDAVAVAVIEDVGLTGAAATPTQRILKSGAQGCATRVNVLLPVKNRTSPTADVSSSVGRPSMSLEPAVIPRTPPIDASKMGKPGATAHADDRVAEGRVNLMRVGDLAEAPESATYMVRPSGSNHRPAAVVELVRPPGSARLSV